MRQAAVCRPHVRMGESSHVARASGRCDCQGNGNSPGFGCLTDLGHLTGVGRCKLRKMTKEDLEGDLPRGMTCMVEDKLQSPSARLGLVHGGKFQRGLEKMQHDLVANLKSHPVLVLTHNGGKHEDEVKHMASPAR